MDRQYITLKHFIRDLDEGFTLVELMVSMVVAFIVLSMGLLAVTYSRKLYLEDQDRTNLNQNLRAAMDLVGTDIKQAGERITDAKFPAIDITSSSELLLRRRLDLPILPVCQAIASSSSNPIYIALSTSPPQGCSLLDSDGDGLPDNLVAWRDYRCNQDGVSGCQGNSQEQVRAYIYDGNGNGEFFTYTGEDMTNFQMQTASYTWQRAYGTSSSIYLLEERRFSLSGNVLQLSIDGNTPKKLVNQLNRFEVKAVMQNGSEKNNFPESGDSWQQLKSIKVTFTATPPKDTKNINNFQAFGQFFPRNVISR